MTARAGFVTGTALALLMATGYAVAAPTASTAEPPQAKDMPLVLAQADPDAEETEEERRRREEQPEEAPQAEEPRQTEEAPRGAEPVPGQPPADATPPPPAEAPRPPQEEPAPTPPEQPAQPAPTPPPAGGGAEPIPGQPPAGETPPQEEQPAPTPPEEPAPPPAQPAPTPPPAGGGAEPIPGQPPAGTTPPPPTEAPRPPQEQQPAPTPPPAGGGAEPIPGQPPAGTTPPPPTEAPRPPQEQPAPTPPPAGGGAEPIPGQPPAGATPPQGQQPAPTPPAGGGAAEPVRDAPILDSDKEAGDAAPADAAQQPPAEPPAPPPATDAEAQQLEQPVQVESLREEEGRRVERREERRERREGADILREIGDRLVIQLGNNAVVQSDDRRRLEHNASEVYYEELPRGRTRETVVRPNGVQVVTIRDRYGDVVRRSRIMPDGREYVLVYAGDGRDRDERRGWRDPGLDLPPLRLGIPVDEYILDAGRVDDAGAYYDFLDQPPVDRVRRLYSVDEVRYSARVRDSVRRIDLDTITFDFGSASIAEDAIPRLSTLADAMGRLLDDNPAETFLIEGHTDAVGSDLANLALSDRRAEAVAAALTNVFGIPPENLVTQGYGERYLKVNTQEPERENRRVAVRRITPLVAPVASGQ